MVTPGSTAQPRGAARDHGFHPLEIARVVHETADARSFVFDVPAALAPSYAYEAGQFCTFRVHVAEQTLFRCYSMSSSPAVDAQLQVTVKRVPGGAVSNWMIDTLAPGSVVETSVPAGRFCLGAEARDIVAFAAGSGITPVFSVLKHALATTSRRVRLLYANRDRESIIFRDTLAALAGRHADRLEVAHHLDVDCGFVGPDELGPLARTAADTEADVFVCGPGPFMDIAEIALAAQGIDDERIHIERFTPVDPTATPPEPLAPPSAGATQVTIQLDGRTAVTEHRPGATLLQTARQAGLSPPYSCESGNCATCMAKLVEGSAMMHVNDALTADEVADGWVLTCQAVPTTPSVRVVYGYEGG
jgi:3-ketosteroid 9alpha-monooxygenase subunit B